MTKQLEKWYVWDKAKTINGVHRVLMSDGQISFISSLVPLGQVEQDKEWFVAYTLGETVPSKRKCIVCAGNGCQLCA